MEVLNFEEEGSYEFGFSNENCSVCLHMISNPICIDCYLNHVTMWLVGEGMSYANSRIICNEVKKKLPWNNSNEERCVVCGEGYLGVCSYCFVFITSQVLGSFSFSSDFEDGFRHVFSYKGGEFE